MGEAKTTCWFARGVRCNGCYNMRDQRPTLQNEDGMITHITCTHPENKGNGPVPVRTTCKNFKKVEMAA